MSDLPAGWVSTPVTAVARFVRGVTYSKSDARDSAAAGLVGILRASNIGNFRFDLANLVYVPHQYVSNEQKLQVGDVVIATSSGSVNVVGKASPVRTPMPLSFGAFCGVLRPASEMEPRYFGRYFQSNEYRLAASAAARGVNINNLKRSDFDSFAIAFPGRATQQQIADKLDALIAKVDLCRARLNRVPQVLKKFREAVLDAAVSGRLTEEWRGQSPVNLARDVKLEDDSIRVPESWRTGNLGDAIDPLRPLCYGVVQPGAAEPSGIQLIRVQDMEGGQITVAELRTITTDVDEEYGRSRVSKGDLLISVVGTIGRTAIVPPGLEANIARAIARVAPGPGVDGEWLRIWLDSAKLQWWLLRSAKEVARKTLNLGDLEKTPLALPSLEEQKEIVRRVGELFALSDSHERRYRNASALVERLIPTLLTKAFRGELVPQDPNDEPAIMLLDRIRSHKEVVMTAKKKTKRIEVQTASLSRKTEALTVVGGQRHSLARFFHTHGRLQPEALLQASGLGVEEFYDQLKADLAAGLIREIRSGRGGEKRWLELIP